MKAFPQKTQCYNVVLLYSFHVWQYHFNMKPRKSVKKIKFNFGTGFGNFRAPGECLQPIKVQASEAATVGVL